MVDNSTSQLFTSQKVILQDRKQHLESTIPIINLESTNSSIFSWKFDKAQCHKNETRHIIFIKVMLSNQNLPFTDIINVGTKHVLILRSNIFIDNSLCIFSDSISNPGCFYL